jgi:hypothetical protein
MNVENYDLVRLVDSLNRLNKEELIELSSLLFLGAVDERMDREHVERYAHKALENMLGGNQKCSVASK